MSANEALGHTSDLLSGRRVYSDPIKSDPIKRDDVVVISAAQIGFAWRSASVACGFVRAADVDEGSRGSRI
jgi:hypothetical protein